MHLQKAKAESESGYRKMLERQERENQYQAVEMADTQYEALKAAGKLKKSGK